MPAPEIPTCAVSARLYDQNGLPVVGASITAQLDRYEIHDGYVVPQRVEAITDANGFAVLNLWPNALGSVSSLYKIKVQPVDAKSYSTVAMVPNLPTADLSSIAQLPPIDGKTDFQQYFEQAVVISEGMVDGAQTARDAAVVARTAAEEAGEQAQASASSAGSSATAATDQARAAAASRSGADSSAGDALASANAAAASADAAVTTLASFRADYRVGTVPTNPLGFNDQGSVFIGKHAGETYDVSLYPAAVGIGAYALSRLSQTYAEDTAVGVWAAKNLTTGNYCTAIGMNAMGAEETGNGMSVVGCDASRNSMGSTEMTVMGNDSARNGLLTSTTAIGVRALHGNGSSVTFDGTVSVGDVVTLRLQSSEIIVTDQDKTYTYTVKAGDTLASIATGLRNAITASPMRGLPASLQGRTDGAILALDFPGTSTSGWKPVVTCTVSGGSLITAAVGTGSKPNGVVAIGHQAAQGMGMTNPSATVLIGWDAGRRIVSASRAVGIGDGALFANTTGNDNTAVGHSAGRALTTGTNNVMLGSNAGLSLTIGDDNIVIGGDATNTVGAAGITTGSGNVVIGRKIGPYSPTAVGSLNIQGIIFGVNNNATGAGVSTGNAGVGIQQPTARWEVQNSNPAIPVSRTRSAAGDLLSSQDDAGNMLNVSAAGVNGYGVGAGGTVTQATSKSTAVTLNKQSGRITLNGAALAAGAAVSFQLNNSVIKAADVVLPCVSESASSNAYAVNVDWVRDGFCRVCLRNQSAVSLSEAITINFVVHRGAAS